MNKISCDICIDLIPLVKDGITSKDSYNAVIEHINKCQTCKKFFDEIYEANIINNENIKMNDKKVISKIRNRLMLAAIIMVILGSFIGVGISESEWMFYNIVLMPTIGALGYFAFNKKVYIVPIGIFALTSIWNFIKYIIERSANEINITDMILVSETWAVIYTSLCILGVLIGFLLYIAFKKENE